MLLQWFFHIQYFFYLVKLLILLDCPSPPQRLIRSIPYMFNSSHFFYFCVIGEGEKHFEKKKKCSKKNNAYKNATRSRAGSNKAEVAEKEMKPFDFYLRALSRWGLQIGSVSTSLVVFSFLVAQIKNFILIEESNCVTV